MAPFQIKVAAIDRAAPLRPALLPLVEAALFSLFSSIPYYAMEHQ